MSKLLVALVLVFLASAQASIEAERVVCNFYSSAAYRRGEYAFNLTDLPVSLCTHVVYEYVTTDYYSDESPFFILNDHGVTDSDDALEKFSSLKRTNPDLKLLLSLRSQFLPEIVSKPQQREELVKELPTFIARFEMEGIELHWNGKGPEANRMFYLLVEELKNSFRAAGHPTWEVIVLVDIEQPGFDHARLCGLADFVHVLGKSERKSKYFDSKTVSPANTFNIDDQKNITLERALQHWIGNSCPVEKMVLGVVFTAELFKFDQPAQIEDFITECPVTEDRPYCGYFEMCQKFQGTKWTLGWDDTEGWAPHAFHNKWWVAYENEASVGRKGKLAREKRLAGVYAVTLDLDDYRGKCGTAYPLLRALTKSFREEIES